MKKYTILTGVMAAAVLCGTDALAQLSYSNGDMLAAFGKAGSSVDVVVDLGSIVQFQRANTPTINFAGVSAALNSTFGGTTGLYWAVFGINDTSGNSGAFNASVTQADPNTIWDSLARPNGGAPNVGGSSASQNNALGDIQTIAFLAANPSFSTTISPNIAAVSSAPELAGFTPQMANGGNLNGDWPINMLNSGPGVSDVYQSDPGSPFLNQQTYLGNAVLDPSGNFSFNPVPEPTTFAMIGSGALALLVIRRRSK